MNPIDKSSGLTFERLREVLRYEPETGRFFWIEKPSESARCTVGDEAGCLEASGYIRIWIDGKRYVAQRLAWLYMTGEWPSHLVDHEDLDRANNSWTNLRAASNSENKANGRTYKKRKDLPKGVYTRRGKFGAQIVHNYKHYSLGSAFDTPEEAHAAYLRKAEELHGDFANSGKLPWSTPQIVEITA